MLPDGKRAFVEKDKLTIHPVFPIIQKEGNIEEEMMFNTYNMGTGMMLCVDEEDADTAVKALKNAGENASVVGCIKDGDKGVTLC